MSRSALSKILLAVFSTLCLAAPASGQAARTWVSGVGDDANPCSRTAPCKTFAGAISKTAASGEISVLDAGSFGAVTITKSIRIVAEGAEGGLLAAGTNGVVINAGPADVVELRGLVIEGAGTGLNGIRFLAGGALHVENCAIRGFRGAGGVALDVQPAGPSQILVSHSTLADNVAGVLVAPTGGDEVTVFLDDVIVKGHSGAGITADGAAALVRLNRSTIVQNAIGLLSSNQGRIESFRNNAVAGNGADGKPTGSAKLR